jgi:hypothetical protein
MTTVGPPLATLTALARRQLAARVPPEGPAERCRNALMLLRLAIDTGAPVLSHGTSGIAVPVTTIARLQALLEVVSEQLEASR